MDRRFWAASAVLLAALFSRSPFGGFPGTSNWKEIPGGRSRIHWKECLHCISSGPGKRLWTPQEELQRMSGADDDDDDDDILVDVGVK